MHVGRDTALRIEDYLDADGHIALPGGITLLSFLDRNIAQWAHSPAFRYLDYTHDDQARVVELTWSQLGSRLRAVGARLPIRQRQCRQRVVEPAATPADDHDVVGALHPGPRDRFLQV